MTARDIRALTGMTQRKFSEATGIPYRTIQSWEENDRICPPYVLDLLLFRVENDPVFKANPQKD